MKVYESEGTFNCEAQTFNLKVQTTDINPDAFYISAFYNICNKERFAIVGILQTKDGNTKDFSNYPPDSSLVIEDFPFSDLDTISENYSLRDLINDLFEKMEIEKLKKEFREDLPGGYSYSKEYGYLFYKLSNSSITFYYIGYYRLPF